MRKNYVLHLTVLLFAAFVVYVRLDHPRESMPKELQIKGFIVPHHDAAKELFHASLEKLKTLSQPEIIVVYGTNHYYPTSQTYTTTTAILSEYSLGDDVFADDERIQKEHSIQTVSPYLQEYFPNAKIIPIIVSARYENIEAVAEKVNSFIRIFDSEKTLFIASVDFAHDVSLHKGLQKNQESINSIETFNIEEILQYQDDHLDSPLAIVTLLLTMKQMGVSQWQTWHSSHGALISNYPDLNGTSYVIGAFAK